MPERPTRTHVFLIDGTLSRLHDGHESNVGLIYKLLASLGPNARQTVGYDPGVQGTGWGKWVTVIAGSTINHSIEAGYATLCSRYVEGDRIILFGYSRGAYAVRSLGGFIGRIGLLRRRHATQRRIHRAFRYYQSPMPNDHAERFSRRYCRRDVPIQFIGAFDTVSALGIPYPFLSHLAPMATDFHDHHLGPNVGHACHALALDETRTAYAPVLWERNGAGAGRLEQVWFAGAHADIGGQVGGFPAARPLSNIPLVWMLGRAESCGLLLPENWRARFPTDAAAPAFGTWRQNGRYFVTRAARIAGRGPCESEHPSVQARRDALPRYRARARWADDGIDVTSDPDPDPAS
ncbi:DUF2235 domain-containing protein [Halovulum marinum]|nr:DUF2235 domain-containing protein [Halovulum marinum]